MSQQLQQQQQQRLVNILRSSATGTGAARFTDPANPIFIEVRTDRWQPIPGVATTSEQLRDLLLASGQFHWSNPLPSLELFCGRFAFPEVCYTDEEEDARADLRFREASRRKLLGTDQAANVIDRLWCEQEIIERKMRDCRTEIDRLDFEQLRWRLHWEQRALRRKEKELSKK